MNREIFKVLLFLFLFANPLTTVFAVDYSTCSSNDTATLQMALTANQSVRLTCMATVDKVVLSGTNKVLTATATGGIKVLAGGTNENLLVYQCTDCKVSGLRFDGSASNTTLLFALANTRLTVENNRFVDPGGQAVFAVRNTNSIYRGNTITSRRTDTSTGRGLWIGNPGQQALPEVEIGAIIERNTVTGLNATGIVCMCINSVIRDNHVADTNGAGIAISSYQWAVARNVLVSGNTLMRNAFHGLQADVVGGGARSSDVTVIGNTMTHNAYSGVYAVNAEKWLIAENIIEDNGTYEPGTSAGVLVDFADVILISRNRISNATGTQDFNIRIQSGATNTVVQE